MRRRTSSDVPSYTSCTRRDVSLAANGGRVAEKSRDGVANGLHDVAYERGAFSSKPERIIEHNLYWIRQRNGIRATIAVGVSTA